MIHCVMSYFTLVRGEKDAIYRNLLPSRPISPSTTTTTPPAASPPPLPPPPTSIDGVEGERSGVTGSLPHMVQKDACNSIVTPSALPLLEGWAITAIGILYGFFMDSFCVWGLKQGLVPT